MDFVRIFLDENVVKMEYEIALMALLLITAACLVKSDRTFLGVLSGIFIFFSYIHRALLPMIVSLLWCVLVVGLIAVLVSLSPRAFLSPLKWAGRRIEALTAYRPYLTVILLILLIQVSRINIAIDYDSLRYGLRSDVLLSDSGVRGFFSSMGLVNSVYTYPKGYELLILPMLLVTGGRSFGPALFVNIWMLVGVILVAGEVAERIFPRSGAFSSAAVSLIPGITNMSITAKSDLATLLTQLLFVLAVVCYIRRRDADLVGYGLAALILSYAFKPTALIFSSALGLTALVYLLVRRVRLRMGRCGARALGIGIVFTGLMTVRTFLITGVPFTSIYTGLFTKLGFTLRYPYRLIDSAGSTGRIEEYIARVLRFFFCPTGEDMEHVIMAWGGIVFLLLLIAAILLCGRSLGNIDFLERLSSMRGEEADTEGAGVLGFIYTEFFTFFLLTLISLFFLSQVDGNYFALFYALSAITGGTALFLNGEALLALGAPRPRLTLSLGRSHFGVVFLATVMIFMTAVTSWCGAVGFTPVDFINKGYYDHVIMYGLKNPLDWDPHTRVVAFAHEPECYKLRGRVESWVDIDGYGGNVYLTDTKLDIFKEYLCLEEIDYIYLDLQFIGDTTNERRVRAGVLFGYLLEDGCFSELIEDPTAPNCIFCRIDRERVGVSWEEPMGEELEERTAGQLAWLEALTAS